MLSLLEVLDLARELFDEVSPFQETALVCSDVTLTTDERHLLAQTLLAHLLFCYRLMQPLHLAHHLLLFIFVLTVLLLHLDNVLSIGHEVVLELSQFPLHLGQTLLVLPDALVDGTLDVEVALFHGEFQVLVLTALLAFELFLQSFQSLFQHDHGLCDG